METIIQKNGVDEVIIDEKGSISVKCDERFWSLTSKYIIEKEEQRFIQKLDREGYDQIYLVFGLGRGEWIYDPVVQDILMKNRLLIIEPSNQVARAFSVKHLDESDDRVTVYSGPADNLLMNALQTKGVSHNNYRLYVYGNYGYVYQEAYKEWLEYLKKYIHHIMTYVNTVKKHNEIFTKNMVKNILTGREYISINQLKGKGKGMPALIVSAGPSLDKQLPFIHRFNGLIFSGGRTLKLLLDQGVSPDFLVSVDGNHTAYLLIESCLDARVPLITSVVSSDEIIEQYEGDKVLMNYSGISDATLLGKPLESLDNGGSVANTTFSIANYMACDPIVFVGQDLAHTDNKHHSEHTMNEKFDTELSKSRETRTIKVEGYYEGTVSTTPTLHSFLTWFESAIWNCECRVINCTEGGAKIRGTEQMPFATYLQSEINENASKLEKKDCWTEGYCPDFYVEEEIKEEIWNMVKNVVELLFQSKRWAASLEKYYRNKNKNMSKINRLLQQLDENDKKVIEVGEHRGLLRYYFADAFLDFDRYIKQRSLNEAMTLEQIATSNQQFYESLYAKAVVFEESIRKVLGDNDAGSN